jgi:hypothetical protein
MVLVCEIGMDAATDYRIGRQHFFLAVGISSLRNVAVVAALGEEQGSLMGTSHSTTQRRDVRKEENRSADLERSVVRGRWGGSG